MVGIARGIAAALTGGMEAVAEEQQARNKALQKKIEKIQASALERSKSKYKAESDDYFKRKAKLTPLLDVTDVAQREYDYARTMDKVKDMDEFKAFKDSGGKYDVSDEAIRAAIGDEPIFSYDEADYDTVRAPSVVKELAGKLGFDVTEDESVASQMAAIEAAQAAKSAQKGATTYPLRELTSEFKPVVSSKEKDTRGPLLKKYDDALEIAKRQGIENPEEFAFNMVKADKENKDLRGTTRKKFDDLVDIKVNEMKMDPTKAKAEAMAEVLREEKDSRSAFQKKFDEKVELYVAIKKMDKAEAEKLALADIEQENAINRDIVVPTIMAIANGQKVPAAQMAAFKAYNASRQNFFTQALSLGGKGLDQFVTQPGENPMVPPTPSSTVKVQPKAMPVEQALSILLEKPTPEMVQFFIDTYGADKLPPEFQQQ